MQQRLTETVDELQGVIQEIRTAIFDLHGGAAGPPGCGSASTRPSARSRAQTCGPRFSTSGRCRWSTPALADHAEAVVREAVSNAVRHAEARTLTITVRVEDELLIEVVDDGRGIAR